MRTVFFGSPAFALPSLRALLAAGHEVALVVTQPDRPAGRGLRPSAPPVARAAAELGLPLWQTSSVKGEAAQARLAALDAEVMALTAFAALIPENVLGLSPRGILNVHPSLLPRWRGASPIQAALEAGDKDTGVTIIRLVREMDAGPILLQRQLPIAPADDYLSLEPRLAQLGADLLVEAIEGLARGTVHPQPQPEEGATYCRRIEREHGRIDWHEDASTILNKVRALRGWPQAFTTWEGRLLKVLRAEVVEDAGEAGVVAPRGAALVVGTGRKSLRLDEVVLEGKRPMDGAALLRGHPSVKGARLGG